MRTFFCFLIFYKYLIDEVLYINTRLSSHKTSFNAVSKINLQYYKYCNSWKVISRAILLNHRWLVTFYIMKKYKTMNWYKKNEGLQQSGVMPFEIRILKKGHIESGRAQRFYIAEIVRHRGTVGAWSSRGYLRVLSMLWSTSFPNNGLQYFLKRFLPKLLATRTLRLCRSLWLRHLRDIVFYVFTSVFSPSLCAFYM